MYRILKKYMNEHFSQKYFENNKAFSFYTYYSNIGTFIKHTLTAEKDRFICRADLPFEVLYDDDYFMFQIETIAKINNNLESGYIEVNDKDKSIAFCVEFIPRVKYSEFSENYYMDCLQKLSFYGSDVVDEEFGNMLNESLAYWWTA